MSPSRLIYTLSESTGKVGTNCTKCHARVIGIAFEELYDRLSQRGYRALGIRFTCQKLPARPHDLRK